MQKHDRITLHDIAQIVDAPLEQVTKVILGQPGVSDEFRRRVMAAMAEAGLVRISRETEKGTIGVVIPGTLDGDYIAGVVNGISERVKTYGYSLALYLERMAKEHELTRMLGPGGCHGIIAVVPNNYSRLLELCHQHNRPYVLVDYQGDDELADALTVEVHNGQAIVDMMEYLYGLGHRRIGFLTGHLRHASARQRMQGYHDAIELLGLPYDPALVREGDWFHPSGYQLTLELLNLDDPPTAVVASNDLMAFGAIQAARQLGLEIGRDVSITGFDDIDMALTVTPPLTTIRQPMIALGEAAVDLLADRLSGKPIPNPHVALATELVVRKSTGAAPR